MLAKSFFMCLFILGTILTQRYPGEIYLYIIEQFNLDITTNKKYINVTGVHSTFFGFNPFFDGKLH